MTTTTSTTSSSMPLLALLLLLGISHGVQGWSLPSTRKQFLHKTAAATATSLFLPTLAAQADDSSKLTRLSNTDLKQIIEQDVVNNQFLVTGKLTRNVYDEGATFTDEIDTYSMPQWIQGTQRLFRGDGSNVRLVGDINVSEEKVEFRFDEDLMFNIPLLHPVVNLSGKVVLERSPDSGLITSYREFWDQDVKEVLKTARFF